jgi:hypothetical protein
MKKITLLCCLGMWAVSPLYGQGNGGSTNSPTNNGNGNGNNPNQNALRWDRQGNTVDTSEFIGTINQQPLKVKTGNQERMRITPDGKVGIGIWNPLEKFDVLGTIRSREDIKVDGNIFVNGTSNFYGEALFSGNVRMSGLQTSTDLTSGDIIVRGDGDVLKKLPILELADIVYQPRLCLDDDPTWLPTWSHGPGKIYSLCAKVGVFTDNPEHPLDINGHGQFRTTLSVNHRLSIGTEVSSFARLIIKNPDSGAAIQIDQTGNMNQYNKLLFMEYSDPSTEIIHVTGPNGHRPLLIDASGNLRLANANKTIMFMNADEETFYTRRIVVNLETWPDYVFESNYYLPTLEEVKKHIAEMGYLPGMPSREEVLKNGVDLGQMNHLLLEKVEGLTLYLIEQKRLIQEQEELLQRLVQRIDELEEQNMSIELSK